MQILIEYKTGTGDKKIISWAGDANSLHLIRNDRAREAAEVVARDGKARQRGMWIVSAAGAPVNM